MTNASFVPSRPILLTAGGFEAAMTAPALAAFTRAPEAAWQPEQSVAKSLAANAPDANNWMHAAKIQKQQARNPCEKRCPPPAAADERLEGFGFIGVIAVGRGLERVDVTGRKPLNVAVHPRFVHRVLERCTPCVEAIRMFW